MLLPCKRLHSPELCHISRPAQHSHSVPSRPDASLARCTDSPERAWFAPSIVQLQASSLHHVREQFAAYWASHLQTVQDDGCTHVMVRTRPQLNKAQPHVEDEARKVAQTHGRQQVRAPVGPSQPASGQCSEPAAAYGRNQAPAVKQTAVSSTALAASERSPGRDVHMQSA